MTHPETAPTRSPAASLAVYYLLLATVTVSLIGSQISEYAVGIAVFRATGHATPLALVAFYSAAPMVLLTGLSGAIADRFDRRGVMLIANIGMTAVSGLLLFSFASGAFRLWHLYALTVASSVFGTLATPAFQASIAMLVPDAHRDRANALGQVTGPAAGVVAPAAAGLLYAAMGVVGAIAIDMATFIVATLVLVVVRIPKPPQTVEGVARQAASVWRQAFDGFRFLGERPSLAGVCAYVSAVNFLAGVAFSLITPYLLSRTGSAGAMGVVLAVMNAGAIAGALTISALGQIRSRMHVVMLGIISASVFLGLAGVAQAAWTLAASLFLMMLSLAFSNAPFWSLMQAKVPPELQGRVFAAYLQGIALLNPLAFLIAGPLADKVFEPARRTPGWTGVAWLVGAGPGAGMGLIFVIAGGSALALSLAVYAVPAVRSLDEDVRDHGTAEAG